MGLLSILCYLSTNKKKDERIPGRELKRICEVVTRYDLYWKVRKGNNRVNIGLSKFNRNALPTSKSYIPLRCVQGRKTGQGKKKYSAIFISALTRADGGGGCIKCNSFISINFLAVLNY